jgi:hypothetical protein
LTGSTCYHGFLFPICPPNGNSGCYNMTTGVGRFFNGENDPTDVCGDIVDTFDGLPAVNAVNLPHDPGPGSGSRFLRVQCQDTNDDGIIDIGTCISWQQNSGQDCRRWNDTVPGAPSKCRCGRINIGLPLRPGGGGGGPNAGPIIGLIFGIIVGLALLASGICVVLIVFRRRRKAAPATAPEPVVAVKTVEPAPIVDKPKDHTTPGTRYIGFGQANIKVKWGVDAPPSAPRGHDKYDRWSMVNAPTGSPMPASPSSMGAEAPTSPRGAVIEIVPQRPSLCSRLFPCCFAARKPLAETTARSATD